MAALNFQYNQQLMQQQAELNDPTWWETFGSIVGMGLGIWGMGGFKPFWQSWGTKADTA